MNNTQNQYNDRIVAFLDIQGFSEDVRKSHKDEKLFNKIKQILTNLKKEEVQEWKESLATLKDIDPEFLEKMNDYQCTAVSDSVIYSVPSHPNTFGVLCSLIARIQWSFLWNWNYLIRGYVTRGECYHKEGIIFGEAYMRAYEGCEQNPSHKLPYILLQKQLVINSEPSRPAQDTLYHQDHLGRYFINYASLIDEQLVHKKTNVDVNQQVERAISFIEKSTENTTSDIIKEKYDWTKTYCQSHSTVFHSISNLSI